MTSGQTRKGDDWPTRKDKRGGAVSVLSGQRKGPAGVNLRGVNEAPDYLPFPARADRMSNRVNSRHKARYPRTRSNGFT